MTVATPSNRINYVGNGILTVYPYPFPIFADADLKVYVNGVLKTLTTDYTVSGAGNPSGGNVTFVVPPGDTLPVSILRRLTLTQGLDLVDNDRFPAESVESELDRLTMIDQQQDEAISRSVKVPVTSTLADVEVPDPQVTANQGKVVRIKQDGTGFDAVGLTQGLDVAVITTKGDLVQGGDIGAPERLPYGADGRLLGGTSGKVAWRTPAQAIADLGILPLFRSYLAGLGLANSAGDPTNDIDIAVGMAMDNGNADMLVLASALTKQLDAAWAVGTNAGGLDTGAIGNNTYHVWLIKRPDTGVVDALFSLSASAPTMPANYTLKRRVGSIMRVGAAIVLFSQDGDYFWRKATFQDVAATNPGTAAVTRTLSVPTGITVRALLSVGIIQTTADAIAYLSPLVVNDEAPSTYLGQVSNLAAGSATIAEVGAAVVLTNTSAQIRSRVSASDANTVLTIATLGWVDRRGRDA